MRRADIVACMDQVFLEVYRLQQSDTQPCCYTLQASLSDDDDARD